MRQTHTLREHRAARLLSSKGLAAATGVSNKTILGIENRRQVPTFRTIQRLSEGLCVEPGEVQEFADAIEVRGRQSRPESQAPSNG